MDEWAGGQKYGHLTAKISQMHWSPNFLTLGAPPCMLHAHESSAKKMVEDWLICINKMCPLVSYVHMAPEEFSNLLINMTRHFIHIMLSLDTEVEWKVLKFLHCSGGSV